MEGAGIYQIAKNCRTSVEMIEKYYATHIKTRLDASVINVRGQSAGRRKNRPKASRKTDMYLPLPRYDRDLSELATRAWRNGRRYGLKET